MAFQLLLAIFAGEPLEKGVHAFQCAHDIAQSTGSGKLKFRPEHALSRDLGLSITETNS